MLEIDNPEEHNYNEHDVDICTGFANVLAEAVDTSRRNAATQAALVQMKDVVADRNRLMTSQTWLLAERVVLTHELQHRVRNNLQFVNGMLNNQIESADDSKVIEALSPIARRVMTLADVYDHLLGAELGREVDFGGYLGSLCDTFDHMEGRDRDIKLTCATQSLIADLNSATALALVVAELISNCYRHAFPGHQGTIAVSLAVTDSGGAITVADNGVGYQEAATSTRRGLGLVRRLMEQLNGTAEVVFDQGTRWILRFGGPALPMTPIEVPDVYSPPRFIPSIVRGSRDV